MDLKQYKKQVLQDPRSKKLDFTSDGRLHYVYRVTELFGDKLYYYGSRSDSKEPSIGQSYFTCSRNKKFYRSFKAHPENYSVKIVHAFNNPADKMIFESYLHQKFDVKNSSKFLNRANQTAFGFDTTGKFLGGNNPSSKLILQINPFTGEIMKEWDSIRSAAKKLGGDRSNIGACLHGRSIMSQNCAWCYKEEYNEEFKRKVIQTNYKLRLSILQINTKTGGIMKKWDSIKQAVDKGAGNSVRISLSLKNYKLTSKGCVWVYPKNYNEELRQKIIDTSYERFGSNHPAAQKIYKLDKNTKEILETFECIKDAHDTLKRGNINTVLSGKQKTAGGFKWAYAN